MPELDDTTVRHGVNFDMFVGFRPDLQLPMAVFLDTTCLESRKTAVAIFPVYSVGRNRIVGVFMRVAAEYHDYVQHSENYKVHTCSDKTVPIHVTFNILIYHNFNVIKNCTHTSHFHEFVRFSLRSLNNDKLSIIQPGREDCSTS